MRYIETPNDCLITPMRRGSQSQSQPDVSDVFMETSTRIGASTRLERIFQPDWDASILDPVECQEAPVIYRGKYGQRQGNSQEIEIPVVYRDDDGQTRDFSSAASRVIGSHEQLAAYTPGLSREAGPLYADGGDGGEASNGVGQVVNSNGKSTIYDRNISQEAGSLYDSGDSGRTRDFSSAASQAIGSH